MGDITEYTKEKIYARLPSLRCVNEYQKTNFEDLTEIRYEVKVNSNHYAWLWLIPSIAVTIAIVDAVTDGWHTYYFDRSNGKFLSSSKEEAKSKVADKKRRIQEERDRATKLEAEKKQRLEEEAKKAAKLESDAKVDKSKAEAVVEESAIHTGVRAWSNVWKGEKLSIRLRAAGAAIKILERVRAESQIKTHEEAARIVQKSISSLILEGDKSLVEEFYEKALGEYNAVLKLNPNNEEAQHKLSIATKILKGLKLQLAGDALLEQARKLNNSQNFEKAYSLYKEAAEFFEEAVKRFDKAALSNKQLEKNSLNSRVRITEIKDTLKLLEEAMSIEQLNSLVLKQDAGLDFDTHVNSATQRLVDFNISEN